MQRRNWILLGTLALVVTAAVGFSRGTRSATAVFGVKAVTKPNPDPNNLRSDPRVRAFREAYASVIDSVTYTEDDVVFSLGREAIHFQDGRMLKTSRLDQRDSCDSIFYEYALGTVTEPTPVDDMPTYCTDVLESLWGRTEGEIRPHGESVRFLDRRMFLNGFVLEALALVEQDLLRAAEGDPTLASWIDDIDVTYSFITRDIAGSPTRSHHGWGMAVDLVPSSYERKQVYWRWSRVLFGDAWSFTPLDERWSPPAAVVDAFERHGFVWGGKWGHFDQIHFEYRPEIILYNRLVSGLD